MRFTNKMTSTYYHSVRKNAYKMTFKVTSCVTRNGL